MSDLMQLSCRWEIHSICITYMDSASKRLKAIWMSMLIYTTEEGINSSKLLTLMTHNLPKAKIIMMMTARLSDANHKRD